MKPIPIHYAKVKNSKLYFESGDSFTKYLASLEGKDVDVMVEKHKENRSIPQNSYWHGVVVPFIAQELGYIDSEEVCDIFREKFLQRLSNGKLGKQLISRSTSSLTRDEMVEFMDKVIMFCASELNLVVPLPNEIK